MNYGELKQHFADLLNRSDCTDEMGILFLKQGVSRLQRELRIPPMEREITVTAEAVMSQVQIPNDFLDMRAVVVGDTVLDKVPYTTLVQKPKLGFPRYYSRRGSALVFRPNIPEGQTVDVMYYGEFGPLVSDTDENELTMIAPDACLYAALSFAGDFFESDKRAEWEGRYQSIIGELNQQAQDEEMSGGPQIVQGAYDLDY